MQTTIVTYVWFSVHTLYVLLVKENDTEIPAEGDWILNESQLTRHEHTTNTDAENDAFTAVSVHYGSISDDCPHPAHCVWHDGHDDHSGHWSHHHYS